MIKADTIRVFRGKGIFVTIGILVAVLLMNTVVMVAIGDIGSMENVIETTATADDPEAAILEMGADVTGATAAFFAMQTVDNMGFILLALGIFIAAADFTSGTVKNVLSSGASRMKYYFSKLILAGVFTVVMYSLYIALTVILATLFLGFGGTFNGAWLLDVVRPFLGQLWMLLAISGFVVAVTFITKKTAAVIGIYFAVLFAPRMVLMMMAMIDSRFTDLFRFDFWENTNNFAQFQYLSTGDITRSLMVGLVMFAVSTILGVTLFRKAEIK
jgi:ABC-2 type transport system permease protein